MMGTDGGAVGGTDDVYSQVRMVLLLVLMVAVLLLLLETVLNLLLLVHILTPLPCSEPMARPRLRPRHGPLRHGGRPALDRPGGRRRRVHRRAVGQSTHLLHDPCCQ